MPQTTCHDHNWASLMVSTNRNLLSQAYLTLRRELPFAQFNFRLIDSPTLAVMF